MPNPTHILHRSQGVVYRRSFPPPRITRSSAAEESVLLAAIQKEIQRHDFSYFVDGPPSAAQGERGVVVAGCPACRKRINTISQFLDHLTNDAMPALIERLAAGG
jgi:hypothetical protein